MYSNEPSYHTGQGVTVDDKRDENYKRDGFVREVVSSTEEGEHRYNVFFEPGEPDVEYNHNQIVPNNSYADPKRLPPPPSR